ncbi:unnamed protein product [Vitrella brassicaformis CCMP3155]|uniref:Uncharacterized protein n=1 Tax=Vitrella brassicaformis (strain CCMP3155) TaxID=1169540 RepID=A0A0G4EWM9_VITBC|nr:unnamed protein product [Vitrella brassicaformis CCMP3155]|eukprot:CEM02668.1 unnamed protein product [Vitrella brassicaformis CCMP3155]
MRQTTNYRRSIRASVLEELPADRLGLVGVGNHTYRRVRLLLDLVVASLCLCRVVPARPPMQISTTTTTATTRLLQTPTGAPTRLPT